MKQPLKLILPLALGALPAPAMAAANLVVDGNFATPGQNGGWSQSTASNWAQGWQNTNGDTIEIGNDATYGLSCITPTCQNLELDANSDVDVVRQLVTGLVVGKEYDVSWEYGSRTGGGNQEMQTSFGGTLLATNISNPSNYGTWTLNSHDVTATSTSEYLTFSAVAVGGLASYGNEVTDVSVTAVPEPSGWATLLAGLVGLVMIRNFRYPGRAGRAGN